MGTLPPAIMITAIRTHNRQLPQQLLLFSCTIIVCGVGDGGAAVCTTFTFIPSAIWSVFDVPFNWRGVFEIFLKKNCVNSRKFFRNNAPTYALALQMNTFLEIIGFPKYRPRKKQLKTHKKNHFKFDGVLFFTWNIYKQKIWIFLPI